jgi:hypothetical protein
MKYADLDVILLAGRYTLLEQDALGIAAGIRSIADLHRWRPI